MDATQRRALAVISLVIGVVVAAVQPVPYPFRIVIALANFYNFFALAHVVEKKDHLLSAKEKALVVPGIVLCFPISIVVAYFVWGGHKQLLEQLWPLAKKAVWIAIILAIVIVAILASR